MNKIIYLRLTFLLTINFSKPAESLFFSGGSSCGCPTPTCSPQPQQQPCKRTVAYSAKTITQEPIRRDFPYAPDELDIRAAAFGVPLVPQEGSSPYDILHNLGENANADTPTSQENSDANKSPIRYQVADDNDYDLTLNEASGGLYRIREIRRSPSNNSSKKRSDESENDKKSDDLDLNKCNSNTLRKLMIENINDSSSESKTLINNAAELKFGGNVDVICSRGHFSYIFTSNMYCEVSKGLTTCIAFRQSDNKKF